MEKIQDVAVLGICVVMILKEVFAYVRTQKQPPPDQMHVEIKEILLKMGRQMSDLHIWHNKDDADGVKVWYVRQSLEKALISLAQNIAAMTKLLDQMYRENKAVKNDLHEINIKLDKKGA